MIVAGVWKVDPNAASASTSSRMTSTMVGSNVADAAGTGNGTSMKPLVSVDSATRIGAVSVPPADRKKTLMFPPIAPGAYARIVIVCPLTLYGNGGLDLF